MYKILKLLAAFLLKQRYKNVETKLPFRFSLRKGDHHVSIGGHFMEGAWAVVLIYDYLKGSDFAELNLSWRSSMTSVTAPEWQKQNQRRESIKPEFIDFKRYSRFLNPKNSSYDFGLKSLITEK